MRTQGVVLVNLGTPRSPTTEDVRAYLDEFLMDPWVIDIPAPFRWFLVKQVILRTRPARSAEAYQKVWTERGSPLAFHTEDLASQVSKRLGPNWDVRWAMRYGEPSIDASLQAMRAAGIEKVKVLPLYPQYSLAATHSSLVETLKSAKRAGYGPGALEVLGAFYDEPGFVASFAEVGKAALRDFKADHVLFSFHGLPERQVRKARWSYVEQSRVTAEKIAAALGLDAGGWSVSFQSRLGRTPWVRPFTDEVIPELAQKGVKKLAVFCPSFVADCLETLEEIQIRARDSFLEAGGQDLRLVPSLNSTARWADTVAGWVEGRLPSTL